MRRSLVVRPPGKDHWFYDFRLNGHRFRGSCKTASRSEAESIAAKVRLDALARSSDDEPRRFEMTLSEALGRYWHETGHRAATADDIARHSRALIAGLGAETRLSRITTGMMTSFVARRRVGERRGKGGAKITVDRSNATVNRETGHLRTVMIAADKAWGALVPDPDIDWRRVRLDEPENVQTILKPVQEEAFFAELRPDFWPLVEFALLSGLRLSNCITLRERQIDWNARSITFRVKSRKPGRKLFVLPITPAIATLLRAEIGKHPEFIFSYIAKRNRHDPKRGELQRKGERYPFTKDGWRREWDRVRQAIGLPELRFHDLRHTKATRTLFLVRNLKTVQKMLGHADISTTLRYTAVDVDDVRAAMEQSESSFGQPARLVPKKTVGE